jgi:hypothetical protein
MVRVVSLIAGLFGLGFVGIAIAQFVQYGRLKKVAGTNTALTATTLQVMYLAIALLIMGLILAVLGFATAFKHGGDAEGEGGHADIDDERNYSLDAFPDFEDRMLAQQLHNLDGRSALIDVQKSVLRGRLNAARPAPVAAPAEHV